MFISKKKNMSYFLRAWLNILAKKTKTRSNLINIRAFRAEFWLINLFQAKGQESMACQVDLVYFLKIK